MYCMYVYGSQHPCTESVDSKIDCSFLTFAAKIMMHFISESIELRIFLPYAAAACCIPTKQGKTLCKCNTVLSFCSVSNPTTLILTLHYLRYCFKLNQFWVEFINVLCLQAFKTHGPTKI